MLTYVVLARLLALCVLGACGRFNFDPVSGVGTSDAFPARDGPVDVSCIKQLDVGFQHVCVLANDGRVWCWGLGTNSQLGDGMLTSRSFPARATGFSTTIDRLSLGGFHSCGIDTSQQLQCLGANYFAQLATGATGPSSGTAVAVTLPAAVIGAAGGEESHCALLFDGRVYCWGRNFDGEVGDGQPQTPRTSPAQAGITGVIEVAGNNHHVCARDATQIWCWGDNMFQQLGDGTMTDRRTPTPTGNTGSALAVANHTCTIANASMSCWGSNVDGELGDNTTTQRPNAAPVLGLSSVSRLVLGYHHSCAIDPTGSLYCWGRNGSGQVGDNSTTNRLLPVHVLDDVLFAAAGWDFTCAVQSTGVRCWGDNTSGQLGDNTQMPSSLVPIDAVFSCDI